MKIKINRIGVLALIGILGVASSCESNLEVLPEDSIVNELAFSNETLALGVVTGIYSSAQQDDVLNGTLSMMSEWQSDNADFVGTFPTFQEIGLYTTLSTNGSIFATWDDNFETIGSANLVIDNIPGVPGDTFTAEERAQAIAEAKFIRALVNFNLSNLFGQPLTAGAGRGNLSIPLVDSAELGLIRERATLGEIHDFIEQDLLDAIDGLANGSRSTASKGAARALLARLYLYQERFTEAATLASAVIANPFYGLGADYTFYNNSASPEHIFTLVNLAVDGQDSFQGFSGLNNPAPNGRGDTPFTDNLIAAFESEAGDLRFELTQVGADAEGNQRIFTNKYPGFQNLDDDAPVIRVTEMYLIRAEANFRGGSSIGADALVDINTLRSRAGLGDLGSLTLESILTERRKELVMEGHRRMDLLRNGLSLRRPGMGQESLSAVGADLTIFPIPQDVRDLAPQMDQNTGY